jgi:adenosylhomocysteine nucleosidase
MRTGVVVGMAAENRIARRMGWPIAIGGGTARGAAAAAHELVCQGCTSLISFGLAGGLDPVLRSGALVVPITVIAGDERYATDTDLSRILGGPTPHVMLGADAIVANIADKRRLHEQTSASAVDLESGAVARVAAEYGIPFAVMRAICDPAGCALPSVTLTALDARGGISLWRVFAALAAQPGQLPALLTLAADAARARRSLVARVKQIMPLPS